MPDASAILVPDDGNAARQARDLSLLKSGRITAPLLAPGRNCWRVENARRFKLLVDGSNYFSALRTALIEARHTIFILGWDIDSRTRLAPDGAGDGLPDTLGEFLNELVARKRDLRAYLLGWDFAMLYALEREWLPLYKLDWRTHERLSFRLDGHHPTGASHHQKIVVIDDAIAFVGGLDLTVRRWDTPQHRAQDPRRVDPAGASYGPFHDVQAMVDGDVARALGELARERWRRATGDALPATSAVRPEHDPWPAGVMPCITDLRIGIARTTPRFDGVAGVEEVRQLTMDMIAAARRQVYAETQYLSSMAVAAALATRLREPHGPDIVLVTHRIQHGWLEQASMGVRRARLHRGLAHADAHGRFRLYCAEVPDLGEQCLQIHSKVLVIDDDVLTVGSANLNNRSMGFDTECNLVIEAADDARVREAIAAMRNALLAEHLGTDADTLRERMRACPGLIAAIESVNSRGRTLKPATLDPAPELEQIGLDQSLFDPERPVEPEVLVAEFLPSSAKRSTAHGAIVLALVMLTLISLAAAWQWTPLHDWLDVESLAPFAGWLNATPWAPLAVLGVFVLAGVLVFPVTLLIAMTGMVFGPVLGVVYAFAGAGASAAATYWLGRIAGRERVRRLAGPRLNRLTQQLARRGLVAMSLVRVVPLAPFTIVNLVAGASLIGFRDFMLGTAVGMTPGIVVTVLFADRLAAAFTHPGAATLAWLALAGSAALAAAVCLERVLSGHSRRHGQADRA